MAPRGIATQQSRDTRKKNYAKEPALSSPSRWLQLESTLSTVQQNIEWIKTPTMGVTINHENLRQQIHRLRTDSSPSRQEICSIHVQYESQICFYSPSVYTESGFEGSETLFYLWKMCRDHFWKRKKYKNINFNHEDNDFLDIEAKFVW